jgi:hypothetical protein
MPASWQHIDGRIDGDEPEPDSDQDEAVAHRFRQVSNFTCRGSAGS